MKILLTGSTGFIGTELAKYLAQQGHTIHALYRSENKAQKLRHPNIKLFKGNLNDRKSILQAMKSCQQIYHLAAYANVWSKDPDKFQRINYDAACMIFDLALEQRIEKVVFTSTAGSLGPSNRGIVTENTERNVDFFNEYERTKYKAEQKAKEYAGKGLNVVIVHPTRVYGPGLLSKSNSVTFMIKKYTQGKFRILPGDGNSIGNYAYIDDVVRGHIKAMKYGKPGENYVIGGVNVSYKDFFDALARVTGKKYRMFRLPLTLMLFASQMMMLNTKIFGIPPLITPKWVRKYNYNWAISSQKAKDELGYEITTLEKGLEKTVRWLDNQTKQ